MKRKWKEKGLKVNSKKEYDAQNNWMKVDERKVG